MPRGVKYILKQLFKYLAITVFLVLLGLFIYDVNETRKRQLREKGLLPPPGYKRVVQYYEIKPKKINYDEPSSFIDIEEIQKYYNLKYKDKPPSPEELMKPTKQWIFFVLLILIAIVYMCRDAGTFNLIDIIRTELYRLLKFLINLIHKIFHV